MFYLVLGQAVGRELLVRAPLGGAESYREPFKAEFIPGASPAKGLQLTRRTDPGRSMDIDKIPGVAAIREGPDLRPDNVAPAIPVP